MLSQVGKMDPVYSDQFFLNDQVALFKLNLSSSIMTHNNQNCSSVIPDSPFFLQKKITFVGVVKMLHVIWGRHLTVCNLRCKWHSICVRIKTILTVRRWVVCWVIKLAQKLRIICENNCKGCHEYVSSHISNFCPDRFLLLWLLPNLVTIVKLLLTPLSSTMLAALDDNHYVSGPN